MTGGAGFVGSHVADAFVAGGDQVLVVDDLSTGHEDNVPERAELERINVVDTYALAGIFSSFGPKLVCHLAAQASVTVSVDRRAVTTLPLRVAFPAGAGPEERTWLVGAG